MVAACHSGWGTVRPAKPVQVQVLVGLRVGGGEKVRRANVGVCSRCERRRLMEQAAHPLRVVDHAGDDAGGARDLDGVVEDGEVALRGIVPPVAGRQVVG